MKKYVKYSEKEIEFLKLNYKTMKRRDIATYLDRTLASVQTKLKDMRLIMDYEDFLRINKFKRPSGYVKGHIPHNTKKDLEIVVRHANEVQWKWIRTGHNLWQPYHVYVWEQNNSKVPKDHIIRFVDGNSLNCNINNLSCVSKKDHLQLNRRAYLEKIAEHRSAQDAMRKLAEEEKKEARVKNRQAIEEARKKRKEEEAREKKRLRLQKKELAAVLKEREKIARKRHQEWLKDQKAVQSQEKEEFRKRDRAEKGLKLKKERVEKAALKKKIEQALRKKNNSISDIEILKPTLMVNAGFKLADPGANGFKRINLKELAYPILEVKPANDNGKVPVRLDSRTVVFLHPEKITPAYISQLKRTHALIPS